VTIQKGGHKLVAIITWMEELGSFVGCWEMLPEVRRTGDSPGKVFDKLCEVEQATVGAAMNLVFGS